jgi:hypothetical protein
MKFAIQMRCQKARSVSAVMLALGSLLALAPLGLANDQADAQATADAFFRLTDKEDADTACRGMSEQHKRAISRAECLTGAQRWFDAKGGRASSREVVNQRVMSAEEGRRAYPSYAGQGNIYWFRYRAKYPKGTFFEDICVVKDSDDVLRVAAHMPQPAD